MVEVNHGFLFSCGKSDKPAIEDISITAQLPWLGKSVNSRKDKSNLPLGTIPTLTSFSSPSESFAKIE